MPETTTDDSTFTGLLRAAGLRVLSTTAAAPSTCDGQHCSSVSGSAIMREASTSSSVVSLRCWAYSLSEPWRRFFTATAARSAGVRAALVQEARAAHRIHRRQHHARRGVQLGLVVVALQRDRAAAERGELLDAEHQHGVVLPASSAWRARCTAVAPLAQAFSTL